MTGSPRRRIAKRDPLQCSEALKSAARVAFPKGSSCRSSFGPSLYETRPRLSSGIQAVRVFGSTRSTIAEAWNAQHSTHPAALYLQSHILIPRTPLAGF